MNITHKIYEWVEELKTCARVANSVTGDILGRPVIDMSDADLVTRAFIAKTGMSGIVIDQGLDSRLAWQSVAAATWQANGGARFCPSESVAASLVLTKQQPGRINLPLRAQLLQMPKGFMPSPVDGEYEGMMLIARLNETMIYVLSYVARDDGTPSGSRVMFFADDVDEAEAKTILTDDALANASGLASQESVRVRGINPTSADTSENAASMTVRIVRNLASWLATFPSRSRKAGGTNVGVGGVGGSIEIGQLTFLKTEVQLTREMLGVARSLVRANANFEVRKMAMRHVVRGHWKRQIVKSGHKTIWVQPYWRGPDGPTAWGRVYNMRDNGAERS